MYSFIAKYAERSRQQYMLAANFVAITEISTYFKI